MNARDLLLHIQQKLKAAGIEAYDLESRWIAEETLQKSFTDILIQAEESVPTEVIRRADQMVSHRLTGEPLAYILGEKEFYGQPFFVSSDTLIPRPETEGLVEWAVQLIATKYADKKEIKILDIGAGTGCIGLSVLLNSPRATLTSIEKSHKAVAVLKKNIQRHNLENRVILVESPAEEVLRELQAKVDIILANPPYISHDDSEVEPAVRKYEPHEALFSDESGLAHIRAWMGKLTEELSPCAAVGFEIGHSQGQAVYEIFRATQLFEKIYVGKDLSGLDRFVFAER